jgi:WD40 repeat protein
MTWPTSQDYNEAVQESVNLADPSLQGGEVVVNALGLPVPRSGNFADVYQFKSADGKSWALKCFTRKVSGLRDRYARIDEHLAKAKLPFTIRFQFFEEGIQVKGEWFPLLKMEWVEGIPLNEFVAQNLTKPQYLQALLLMWAKLTTRLREDNIAHADLQHGNVLLVPGATPQKLGLKLIDYDGMWVPALAERHSGEVGHPNYQHPIRIKKNLYNADVDRFPHLVIASGLRAALVGGPAIWKRFDSEDNLLFREADLRNPANSPLLKALWELNDSVLRTLVGQLALSASQPLRQTPWLDDVLSAEGGPRLSAEEERKVESMLRAAAPPAKVVPSAVLIEPAFNEFEFFDGDVSDDPAHGRSRSKSAANSRPSDESTPKKSKTPLLIVAAVGAIIAVGAIVGVTLGGKKQATNEVVQRKEDDMQRPSDGASSKSTRSAIDATKAPEAPSSQTVPSADANELPIVPVERLAISPREIVSGPPPPEIAKNGGLIKESKPLSDTIVYCAHSTDEKRIYATTGDGNVHTLDAETLAVIVSVPASKMGATNADFAPKTVLATGTMSAERLYILDRDRHLHVWDPEKGARIRDLNLEKPMAKLTAVHQFVVTTLDGSLFAFDNDKGFGLGYDIGRNLMGMPSVLSRQPFGGSTQSVGRSGDARFGAAYASGKLLVWTMRSGTPVATLDADLAVRWLGVLPETTTVVAATPNQIAAWNYATGRKTLDVSGLHGALRDWQPAIPLKGGHFVTTGSDRLLCVWDAVSGRKVAEWKLDQRADGVAMSPDGKFAAAWHGGTNKVSLWAMPDSVTRLLIPKGKLKFLAIAKAATAVSTKGMFDKEDAAAERIVLDDWRPITVERVQFNLIDPNEDKVRNVILLHSPKGALAAKMPKAVTVPCGSPAKAIHLLGGIAGWGFPTIGEKGSVSLTVRLRYASGTTEDHPLKNGEEIADCVRGAEVPGSSFAFDANEKKQVRYLKIKPNEKTTIDTIELIKGPDQTAPIVLAITAELPD